MSRIAQIVSTARYLPEHVVTNAELTARFTALGKPTVIDKLAARSGITQRFYVPGDWVTSDLALPAAKEALKRRAANPKTLT
jgi:3-oxoacyl-[acyl-carrier-protein] synthase III